MKIKFNISFLFCCFIWTTLCAQQPSYKVVGEDFLAEYDVYSLLQDKEDNIWISTDNGLFKYDGYKFSTYSTNGLKSRALFGLKLDGKNDIYCYNLTGQIVKVVADSLKVYYQIPDTLLGSNVSIRFDDSNRLFISSQHFFYLDKDKKAQLVHNLAYTNSLVRTTDLAKGPNGQILFTMDSSNHIGSFGAEGLTIEKEVPFEFQAYDSPRYMVLANDSNVVTVALNKTKVYKKGTEGWVEIPISRKEELNKIGARYFLTQKNQLWFSCENRGAYAYDLKGNPLFYGHKVFSKYAISAMLEDREGNLWIGTFGKGLLIIPNLSVLDFSPQKTMQLDEIGTLAISPEKEVFLGGQSGTIYRIDKNWNVEILLNENKEQINYLELFREGQLLLFNGKWLDLKTGKESFAIGVNIKEVKKINEEEAIFASRLGIGTMQSDRSLDLLRKELGGFSLLKTEGKNLLYWLGRSYTVHYEAAKVQIWVGTSKGLKLIKKDTVQSILYENQQIIANSVQENKQKIYVGCQLGILIFEEGKLVEHISVEKGLLSNQIRKIKIFDNHLYVASSKGFQVMNLDQRTFLNFESSDGLLSSKILDFDVIGEQVWLVTIKGVQTFVPNQLLQNNYHPKINFTQLKVNGVVSGFKDGFAYPASSNKMEFQFASKSFRNREHFRYEYQMLGLSEEWEEMAYTNNSVLFNSLPPGTYVFSIKSVDDKGYESPIISYSFSVNRPFYLNLWFYVLCVLGITIVVALLFLIRIRILERENKLLLEKNKIEKELLESRQVALRSQMNPHFLFNALNSIQEMIIVNDKQMASKFLGKFADLMRMYLNHSQQSRIRLSEELEALKLYLDLEKVRFEDTLRIDWDIDLELNPEFIDIPSMLIQPYVENALKHGLLHKSKDRLLELRFNKNEKETMLHCVIQDNGIGRKKSGEINKLRNRLHQSFSTSATQKRLELLNTEQDYPISVRIIDLENEEKRALGTKVIISIPIP